MRAYAPKRHQREDDEPERSVADELDPEASMPGRGSEADDVAARFLGDGPFTSVEINATIPPISIDSSVTPWCWLASRAASSAGNARPGGALIHNGWASCEKPYTSAIVTPTLRAASSALTRRAAPGPMPPAGPTDSADGYVRAPAGSRPGRAESSPPTMGRRVGVRRSGWRCCSRAEEAARPAGFGRLERSPAGAGTETGRCTCRNCR